MAAAAFGVSPSVGRSDDDDASDTAAVAESDEAEKADPSICSDDDASREEAVPPPSPTQATQDFETQRTHNAIRIRIIRKTSPNIHKRPASVKK
jgi:hypothetical protein